MEFAKNRPTKGLMTPAFRRGSFSFWRKCMKPTIDIPTWILVGATGAIGVLLRFAFGERLSRLSNGAFPWQTFAVNVLGCLAIGVIAGAIDRGFSVSSSIRIAIMVGFLGGFTTFSSFALEAVRLMQGTQWTLGVGYVLVSNFAGLLAVLLGYQLSSRAWWG
jgi:CrcB protein